MRSWIAVCLLFVLPGCVVGPAHWDGRTNGGRYDPGPVDPLRTGQPGVDDMRSGKQNDPQIRMDVWGALFGRPVVGAPGGT